MVINCTTVGLIKFTNDHFIFWFGPYGSPVILPGAIDWSSILCDDKSQSVAIKSQLQQIASTMYGSPPIHGISLVSKILSDPDIKAIWLNEVKVYFPKFFFPVPLSLCFNFLRYMC